MIALFVGSALILGGSGWLATDSPLTGPRALLPVDGVSLAAALAMALTAITALALHRQRFVALVLMGAVGLVVSLIFVKFSAPDLALTQLSVEVVTVILLLLALYFLPQPPRPNPRRRGHGACAADLACWGSAPGLGGLTRQSPGRPEIAWPGRC
jgi:multicomponent K+:H+ antiporter subunit A